jgi:hypothetical protein
MSIQTGTNIVSDPSRAAGGIELGYAERLTDWSTTSTATVAVPTLSSTVTIGKRPIVVEAGGRIKADLAGQYPYVAILQNGVAVVNAYFHATAAGDPYQFMIRRRLQLVEGSKPVFEVGLVNFFGNGTATVTLMAVDDAPAWLQITEV